MGHPPEKMGQGQCEYIKGDGQRCKAPAVDGAGRCISHTTEPKYIEVRTKARSRGGSAVRSRLEATPGDVERHKPADSQEGALEAQLVAIGAMRSMLESDPHNLRVAAALSLASRRLSQQLISTDLDQRLRAVEEELKKRKRGRER